MPKGNLGNTLSKKFRTGRRPHGRHGEQGPHMLHQAPTSTSMAPLPESSVTQQGDLAEFLSRAELLGARFDSVGGPGTGSLRLLSAEEMAVGRVGGGPGVLAKAMRERRRLAAEELRPQLRIPRRPAWSRESPPSPAELEAAEREAFVRWREAMAALEARDHVAMTPFEKNLDFWRQLWRVLERSRVVVQIVDARDPLFFYSDDLDAYARECGCGTAVLLNKCDLLAPSQLAAWRKHFDAAGLRALFFSAKAEEQPEESPSAAAGVEDAVHVLSPDRLADALAELAANAAAAAATAGSAATAAVAKSSPVVGLVGYPNVGKSSTINSLLRVKKVPESATPGRTKHLQTLPLGDRLVLCDCPGLVMPQFVGTAADLVVHGVLPIDSMRDCLGPVQLLCDRLGRPALAAAYGLRLPAPPEPLTALAVLTAYAQLHGYTTGHGMPHLDRAAREILKDFVAGRDKRHLVYCHPPPTVAASAEAAAAFNGHLPVEEAEEDEDEEEEDEDDEDEDDEEEEVEKDEGVAEAAAGGGGRRARTRRVVKTALTDFDFEFFAQKTADIQFRIKGRPVALTLAAAGSATGGGGGGGSSGGGGSGGGVSKPWKRHNNAKKREKVRRNFRHLDQ